MDNNEMELYKKKFKENIGILVNQNRLNEAKELLSEYKNIVENDIEVYSIEGVIAMMEGKMEEAFEIIHNGLCLDPNNIELLYNKAYLLEQVKKYKESYKLYKDILLNTSDELLKNEITARVSEIKKNNSYIELNGKLSLLFINQKANTRIYDFVINWFHEVGFTILKIIDTDELVVNKNKINKCVILYDLNPVDMKFESNIQYPNIDNERYFLIETLKRELLIKFKVKNPKDYVYLTQNEIESKEAIENLLEVKIKEMYKQIQKIESDYNTQYPVIKLFNSFRHRAKTELIYYKDSLAVKKTWKPGNEKFCEREKFACGKLSRKIKYIPKLLESGKNYIVMPYYKDIINGDEDMKKRILTTYIVDIASFLKQLYEEGYFNPDIHPGQFVFSEKEGLKAIDFEYLQLYEKKPNSFVQSYDILGYPNNFKGDKPNYVGKKLHQLYDNLWVKYTGYNLKQIANLVKRGEYCYDDQNINKVLGLLNYAKTSGKSYNGSLYGSAYHSLKLKGYYFRGQRECNLRLQKVPYNFSHKVVLDIGCNAGGMLHSLSDKIKMGIGIDYDYRLINAGNAIKTVNKNNNLSFYRFDLENEDINLIKNFILSENEKIDICFLLSVCMWIKNWKEVIGFVKSISDNLLFETNGTQQQQLQQIEELKKNYNRIEVIEKESYDDPGQPNRILLFCTNG